jgi:uncharacterized protein YndB with AHSA1/START domain
VDRDIRPAPIRKSMVVKAGINRAFDVFANRMHDWSPAVQSLQGGRTSIVIEPRVGGRWYEISESGSQADWGQVLVWEPPNRMILAWQLDANFSYDPDLITEVEVRFAPAGEHRTQIEFEHRNLDRFGARSEATKASLDSEGGWSGSFALYEKLLEEEGINK